MPLSLYFKDGRAKVEIALARGKKTWDKRQALAERQAAREAEQAVGRRLKGIPDERCLPVDVRQTGAMLHLRITAESDLTDEVLQILSGDPAVSSLAVMRGASLQPVGDIVLADVAREGADDRSSTCSTSACGRGTVHVQPVQTWISERGLEADKQTPGSSADAVVWAEVTQRAYDESELNWGYLSFMTMATLLASIAIVVDSQILVIGAMVLGPEFGASRPSAWRWSGVVPLWASSQPGPWCWASPPSRHLPGRTGGPSAGLDHRGGGHGPSAGHRVHLLARQVVLHRRGHRGGGRGAVTHLQQDGRALGCSSP